MKKLIFYIFAFFSFWGCVKDVHFEEVGNRQPEGKVTFAIGVQLPVLESISTKSFGDAPDYDALSLRVAVFGSSGFLKEYVQAIPDGTFEEEGTRFAKFKVSLSLSDSKRIVHLIANGPESLPFVFEDEALEDAYSDNQKDAYWQRFELENGILARKVWSEATQSYEYKLRYDSASDTYVYDKDNGTFFLDPSVLPKFQKVAMIRNFAKITVESTAKNFVLDDEHAFKIMNAPDRGSIAPYNTIKGKFMQGYKDMKYTDMLASYPGFMPSSTRLLNTGTDVSTFVPRTSGAYLYERTVPTSTMPATYLLIHGTYYPTEADKIANQNGVESYYKIDLMDKNGYYAIYRNFRYRIIVRKVLKAGASTAGDADNMGGSGDISTDAEVAKLTDVSNGTSRILVQYTGLTLINQTNRVEIKYKFVPDATKDTPSNDYSTPNTGVHVTLFGGGGNGNVISDNIVTDPGFREEGEESGSFPNGKLIRASSDDVDGWRSLYFNTTAISDVKKEQKIRITGVNKDENGVITNSIFREVVFSLLNVQSLYVDCSPKWVERKAGAPVDVKVSIPKDLPESMFPLLFRIESEELSITPNGDNLPVGAGLSIIPGKENKVVFSYTKTLSYDDYKVLPNNNEHNGFCTFTCKFKTNKDRSESKVYVSGLQTVNGRPYFHQGFNDFKTLCYFSELKLSNKFITTNNENVRFSFRMENGSVPNFVYLTLEGLKPNDSRLTLISGKRYRFANNGSTTADVNLRTSANGGIYSVKIEAEGYKESSISSDEYSRREVTILTNINNFPSSENSYSDNGVSVTFASIYRKNSGYIMINRDSDFTIASNPNIKIEKIEVHCARYNDPGFSLSSGAGNLSKETQGNSSIYIWQSNNEPGSNSVVLRSSARGRVTKVVAFVKE